MGIALLETRNSWLVLVWLDPPRPCLGFSGQCRRRASFSNAARDLGARTLTAGRSPLDPRLADRFFCSPFFGFCNISAKGRTATAGNRPARLILETETRAPLRQILPAFGGKSWGPGKTLGAGKIDLMNRERARFISIFCSRKPVSIVSYLRAATHRALGREYVILNGVNNF